MNNKNNKRANFLYWKQILANVLLIGIDLKNWLS